jgi:hypothetical protein
MRVGAPATLSTASNAGPELVSLDRRSTAHCIVIGFFTRRRGDRRVEQASSPRPPRLRVNPSPLDHGISGLRLSTREDRVPTCVSAGERVNEEERRPVRICLPRPQRFAGLPMRRNTTHESCSQEMREVKARAPLPGTQGQRGTLPRFAAPRTHADAFSSMDRCARGAECRFHLTELRFSRADEMVTN